MSWQMFLHKTKFPGGGPFPGGGEPPIYVKSFGLNRLGLCKCIMIKLYIF